jgi:DNA-binding GntR family transcriptional regulator
MSPDSAFASGDKPRTGNISSSERVYREIREAIVAGRLAPGDRVVELQVAGQLGVSRTPVREALKRLLAENFVSRDPVGGLVVHSPSPGEVEEAFPVREVLDGLASRLAAYRLSSEEQIKLRVIHEAFCEAVEANRTDDVVMANIAFHEALYEASGNRRLKLMGLELRDFVQRFSGQAYATSSARAREVVREHEAILEAVVSHDPDGAEAAARRHLREAHAYTISRRTREAIPGGARPGGTG